jgi:C1A family cysteine protease
VPNDETAYGWVPDLPDHRDFLIAAPLENLASLPASVDLRQQCPKEVYDQDQLGSCTANAIAGALEFDQMKQRLKTFIPSRLFIYYNERVIEHTVGTDSGAQIRDGIKSVGSIGARLPVPESSAGAQPDERLSRLGLPVRLWIHGL